MSTTVSRRGRKPKVPGGRKKANVMLPVAVHDRFAEETLDLEVPLTDSGAYYMVLGWNAAHPDRQIPMPAYLQTAMAGVPRGLEAPIMDLLEEEALLAS